jgi:hypothetical protein
MRHDWTLLCIHNSEQNWVTSENLFVRVKEKQIESDRHLLYIRVALPCEAFVY